MTAEQLEALIELMETLAIEAAYQATDPGSASPQSEREALRRVYAAFNVQPPPIRGFVMPPNPKLAGAEGVRSSAR